jgi:membrane protease YdiL (CAAX protease family)
MLTEKPWTWDAIVRLLLGAFICLCLGSIVVSIWHYAGPLGARRIAFFAITGSGIVLLVASLVIITKPWSIDELFRPMLFLLGCLSAGLTLAAWTQKLASPPDNGRSAEQMVVAEAAVLIFFIGFLRARCMSWADAFGLRHNRRNAVLSGIVVACIFLPVAEGLQWASAHLMTNLHIEPQEQEAVHALRVTSEWSNRVVLGVLALFLAPIVEEIFFRGMLYPAIKQAGFPRLATFGVSLLFALIHFNVVSFVPLFVLAILLAALYEHTNNLLAPIAAHALFNGLNFAMLYLFQNQLAK